VSKFLAQSRTKYKAFSRIKWFILFDLAFGDAENIRMSLSHISKSRERLSSGGKIGRNRKRVSLLVVALGLTATVVASPAPKVSNATPGTATAVTPPHHWFQVGKASWYGGSFQGRKTANGERFDMNALTCAHRSLPLGSWVRVTNLHNHKTAFLRVNDRGPVPQSLIVDLSYAAAQRLGITGLGKVRMDRVNPEDPQIAEELVASLPPMDAPKWSVAKDLGR
jgi:rare lipoprotein A